MSEISENLFGDAFLFTEIAKLNGITDPNYTIKPGQALKLPDFTALDPTEKETLNTKGRQEFSRLGIAAQEKINAFDTSRFFNDDLTINNRAVNSFIALQKQAGLLNSLDLQINAKQSDFFADASVKVNGQTLFEFHSEETPLIPDVNSDIQTLLENQDVNRAVDDLSPLFKAGKEITKILKDGNKLRIAAKAQGLGFKIENRLDSKGRPTGKVKIFGSQVANELLDLPKNFRTADAQNAKLLKAIGLNTGLKSAFLSKINIKSVGGALTAVGVTFDVLAAKAKHDAGELDDAQYYGELGNIGVKTAVTTAVTVGGTVAVLAGLSAIGIGIAVSAPIIATAAIGIGIGLGVSYLYDVFLKEDVKGLITNVAR